jgi:hypothetical protein
MALPAGARGAAGRENPDVWDIGPPRGIRNFILAIGPCVVVWLSETCSARHREISSRLRESHTSEGKYRLAGANGAVNLNSHLRRRFIMAANTADGVLLLAKKLGGVVLILFGIIGIAVGLEYRTTGFSAGITGAGIVALAWGMALLALKIIRRNRS